MEFSRVLSGRKTPGWHTARPVRNGGRVGRGGFIFVGRFHVGGFHYWDRRYFFTGEFVDGSGVSGLMMSPIKSGFVASRSSTGYFSPP